MRSRRPSPPGSRPPDQYSHGRAIRQWPELTRREPAARYPRRAWSRRQRSRAPLSRAAQRARQQTQEERAARPGASRFVCAAADPSAGPVARPYAAGGGSSRRVARRRSACGRFPGVRAGQTQHTCLSRHGVNDERDMLVQVHAQLLRALEMSSRLTPRANALSFIFLRTDDTSSPTMLLFGRTSAAAVISPVKLVAGEDHAVQQRRAARHDNRCARGRRGRSRG